MANLRGVLQGSRGLTSRLGSREIWSRLNTWEGDIFTTLFKDGDAVVEVNGKEVWRGNVNKKMESVV